MPGPGHYKPKDYLPDNGNYFLSNFKSSQCRTFGSSIRQAITGPSSRTVTPGPGTYRMPSEFGHYGSKYTWSEGKQNKSISFDKRHFSGVEPINHCRTSPREPSPITATKEPEISSAQVKYS